MGRIVSGVYICVLALLISAGASGCASSGYDAKPVSADAGGGMPDLAGRGPEYRKGAEDGCRTAEGNYTKDSAAFRGSELYKEGWFAGRSGCNDSAR